MKAQTDGTADFNCEIFMGHAYSCWPALEDHFGSAQHRAAHAFLQREYRGRLPGDLATHVIYAGLQGGITPPNWRAALSTDACTSSKIILGNAGIEAFLSVSELFDTSLCEDVLF